MSDETPTEAVTGEAAGEPADQAPEQQTSTTDDELPQWAREKLSKANNEAARYRVEAKEAAEKARQELSAEFETKLKGLADEKAAAAAELQKAQTDALKLRTALAVGIPGESATEFAELLQGDTEEEITAHAEKVKNLFGTSTAPDRAVDPSQGLGGVANGRPEDVFGSFVLSQLTN